MGILFSLLLFMISYSFSVAENSVKKNRYSCDYEGEVVFGRAEILVDDKNAYELVLRHRVYDEGEEYSCNIEADRYDNITKWILSGNRIRIEFSGSSPHTIGNYIVLTFKPDRYVIDMSKTLSSNHCNSPGVNLPRTVVMLKNDNNYCDEVTF